MSIGILSQIFENNSLLVKPDNFEQLSGAIKRIINDLILSSRLTQKASEDVKNYTWHKRAESILDFL